MADQKYTRDDLSKMEDDQLMEIAIDQMGLGALGEDLDEAMPQDDEERESLIQTILDAQEDG